MKILIKLYDMENPAADGSVISRQVTEEYLATDDYKKHMESRTSLGGITHKDRDVVQQYKDLVGPNDQVLISNNFTHVITKVFTKPGESHSFAFVEIFDEDNFSGEVRDKIINLKGLIRSGVQLPVSVVIQALWNQNGNCEKIIRIRGVDFTMDPSFKGSEYVKTMSAIDVTPESQVRVFSDGRPSERIKVFSGVAEISEEDKIKTYSLKEIALKYGKNSKEYSYTKNFGIITEKQLEMLSKPEFLENNILVDILFQFKTEVTDDDKWRALQDCFHGNQKSIAEIINSVPREDPDYSELVKMQIRDFVRNIPGQKIFSTSISAVKDRVLMAKYPRFIFIRRLIRSYKLYYEIVGKSISDEDKDNLRRLLSEDINLMLKLSAKEIMQGNNLSALYGLAQFDQSLFKLGDNLSKVYRKVLISEQVLGFVPSVTYVQWRNMLKRFYQSIFSLTFGSPELPEPINVVDSI